MTFRLGLFDEAFEKDSCGIGLIVDGARPAQSAVIDRALTILSRLAHRSALGADGQTSDGAGLLCQIPDAFFRRNFPVSLPERGRYALGQMFAPPGLFAEGGAPRARFADRASALGLKVLAWRKVPVESSCLGAEARRIEPEVYQVFLGVAENPAPALFRLRKWAEKEFRQFSGCRHPATGETLSQFYFCSLSTQTVVYKGLMRPGDLASYYPELRHPDFGSQFAMVHSRFSTNTLPAWELAQPFRFCCHNGEINTIKANRHWMKAREYDFQTAFTGGALAAELAPLLSEGRSDSANFDEAFEALLLTGTSPVKAMMTLVPAPWETDQEMAPRLKALYQHQALRMEPWDGPAALCFSDGHTVGASLDRNGLRPCRYQVLKDGTLIAGSEAGALEVAPEEVAIKSRLKPGQILSVDLASGAIDLENRRPLALAALEPSNEVAGILGTDRHREPRFPPASALERRDDFWKRLTRFDYSFDEIHQVLLPMLTLQEEPTSSMGADTPLALLSDRPQLLTSYFRQLFAQVTNPPIDPIREKAVMSLSTYLGAKPSPFCESRPARKKWLCHQPFLDRSQMSRIRSWMESAEGLPTAELAGVFDLANLELESVLEELCSQAERLVRDGHEVLILSDRRCDRERAAIPPLLFASAVHSHLVKAQLRLRVSLVVESGEPRDVHQMACLFAFGADVVHPYLVEELCHQLARDGYLPSAVPSEKAIDHYYAALAKGLLKVLSKLGISTLQSYRGAQTFEILGLSESFVARYFPGTVSRIGGLDLAGVVEEIHRRWRHADLHEARALPDLESKGTVHFRAGGESHQWNPVTLSKLQQASRTGDAETYREFSEAVRETERFTIRGHLGLRKSSKPLPLEQVEPAAEIVKRFTTGAMSLGALSREAHETLAVAMNRIGGKSNSGEGGEDPRRFSPLANGENRNSQIKQIASARFGVTIEYLNSARELQIKMAQGAKPGEGGQLPGHKVDQEIARLRHSTPGVTLISPPPHHDIYSIEDLAQLIFDLKCANPHAAVSVKLVSEAGVGTIAAGVAKAMAEKILISGDGGGTGASPLSSIRHAGLPWELGLAETQQSLLMNGLRGRVRIEVDGQLRTGRDVAVAALLGADEFGFATAPLVVEGCLMMRKCHLNTCPVGIATQDPELRKMFSGQPDHVVNYFFFVAEELRQIMSELGVAKVEDLVGRTDLLESPPRKDHWKARTLDLGRLLERAPARENGDRRKLEAPDFDERLLSGATVVIQNTDRAVGCRLSGEIARGRKPRLRDFQTQGYAGQSFGAFLASGVTLRLVGEANDYVGKGLSGGRLVLRFDPRFDGDPGRSVIAGNTCLYGATSGSAFIAGVAGERFAVRNSGARAVVEGVGDHGCEYMTGGAVVILGPTGKNFAAGMSGGLAFVYDESGRFQAKCNQASVEIEELSEDDARELQELLSEHAAETGSRKAALVLRNWTEERRKFRKVIPRDYKAVLGRKPQETVTA